jgi:Reverse transcriptase (RNA-dependent DNA polymerase)
VHIFNLSLKNYVFHSKLKTSRTVPIFKTGDKLLCDNYRPISLLSSISKILEKAVANRLVNHLKYNKLLYPNQFGFQEGTSTIHHLLKMIIIILYQRNLMKKSMLLASSWTSKRRLTSYHIIYSY